MAPPIHRGGVFAVVRRGSDAGSRPASSPPRCARRVPSGRDPASWGLCGHRGSPTGVPDARRVVGVRQAAGGPPPTPWRPAWAARLREQEEAGRGA